MNSPTPTKKKDTRKTPETDEVKEILVNKYRKIFIDKLSEKDLDEMQYYLKRQFTENREINKDYKSRFESKLREFFDEEVLTREIVSLEVLISRLRPGDLKRPTG